MKNSRQETGRKSERRGRLAEGFASIVLFLKGYRILFKRYKTYTGEIDIVACKKQYLVIVEVKASQSKMRAYQALQKRQMNRLAKSTELFLAKHPKWSSFDIRFDVMLIFPKGYRHIKNAWNISE